MGNLFSGATEDLLLYRVVPFSLVAFVALLVMGELQVRARLRRHAHSWDAAPVPSDHAAFRTQGALLGPVPREVRVLTRALLAWAAVVGVLGSLGLGVAIAGIGSVWSLVPLVVLVLGIALATSAVRCALAMCDRAAPDVRERLADVRRWLWRHQGAAMLAGSSLFALFVLSNQFFWNGATDRRIEQLQLLAAGYAIAIVLPALAAVSTARGLSRVARHYPELPSVGAGGGGSST